MPRKSGKTQQLVPPDTTVVKCPTCLVHVYAYNQHTCGGCSAKVCYFCEGNPCPAHTPPKEDYAEVSEQTTGD